MTEPTSESSHARPGRLSTIRLLEGGDGAAHQLVAGLLLVLAVVILVVSTAQFITNVWPNGGKVDFPRESLRYLSDILFGVIVLELLSTILTYMQAHRLEATIKDFIVVGLISCVRKILLTGAQSSLHELSTQEFVQEAIGTAVMVVAICLLVGALLFLDRRRNAARDDAFEH